MPSTILQLARDASDELGCQRPASLFAAYDEGDTTDRKLLRALTRISRQLAAGYDWQVLQATHTWTATATEIQASGLPADFERMVMDTAYDLTLKRELCGPLSPDEWANAKGTVIGRVRPAFSIQGGKLLMNPVPTAGNEFAFGYIRNSIGRNAGGSFVGSFTSDTDTALWDDELMVLGILYAYRKIDKDNYAQDERDFELMKYDRIKRDGGGRAIDMGKDRMTSHDMVKAMKSAVFFIDPTA